MRAHINLWPYMLALISAGLCQDLESEPSEASQQESKKTRTCVPLLDIPALINGSALSQKAQQERSELQFAIGDIDVPIAQSGGSVHSALKMLSSFGSRLSSELEGEEVEEPEEDSEEEQPTNLIRFRNNRLNVEGLNLSTLNVHLYPDGDPRFSLGITIKNTSLFGRFSYNGPAVLSETRLAAFYRMSIDNIYLTASSNLTKRLVPSQQERDPAGQYVLMTDNFNMNVSNIGYITIDILDSKDATKPTTNYLLRMLQRVLQKTIKRTYYSFESYIRQTLETQSRRSIDCELTRFSPLLDTSGRSSHQSDLARIINDEIAKLHFDTVPLPNFDHIQSILGTQAQIHLYNGSISGLDHLQLSGETKIKLQDQHLLVNASIGWFNLRPFYNWRLHLGSSSANSTPTTKGFVAFSIKQVDFDAVITKGLHPFTKIVVDRLEIRQLDSPKMDIGGIPGVNRLTRGVVNFFMGRLKQRLSSSIQPVLRSQLERSLNRMSIFR